MNLGEEKPVHVDAETILRLGVIRKFETLSFGRHQKILCICHSEKLLQRPLVEVFVLVPGSFSIYHFVISLHIPL